MARKLPSGAVVSDDGEWCVGRNGGWMPLRKTAATPKPKERSQGDGPREEFSAAAMIGHRLHRYMTEVTDGSLSLEEADAASLAYWAEHRRAGLEKLGLTPPAPAEAGPRVDVARYKSTSDFQRDASKRYAQGWRLEGQSQEPGRTHRVRKAGAGGLIGSLFGLGAAGAVAGGLSGKRDEGPITATWVR